MVILIGNMSISFDLNEKEQSQATCSANGVVRIYECQDIMALGSWNIQHEMAAGHPRSSCVAWNLSKYVSKCHFVTKTHFPRYHPPLIAVGCDIPATLTESAGDTPARLVFFERLHNQKYVMF